MTERVCIFVDLQNFRSNLQKICGKKALTSRRFTRNSSAEGICTRHIISMRASRTPQDMKNTTRGSKDFMPPSHRSMIPASFSAEGLGEAEDVETAAKSS